MFPSLLSSLGGDPQGCLPRAPRSCLSPRLDLGQSSHCWLRDELAVRGVLSLAPKSCWSAICLRVEAAILWPRCLACTIVCWKLLLLPASAWEKAKYARVLRSPMAAGIKQCFTLLVPYIYPSWFQSTSL